MKMSKSKVLWGVGIVWWEMGQIESVWGVGGQDITGKTYLLTKSGCNLWQAIEHILKTCYILLSGIPLSALIEGIFFML